jgi:hypothetical protein
MVNRARPLRERTFFATKEAKRNKPVIARSSSMWWKEAAEDSSFCTNSKMAGQVSETACSASPAILIINSSMKTVDGS